MRAIIMDITKTSTIVLKKDGNYMKIKTLPHYSVGNEIEIITIPQLINVSKYVSIAAILLLCISLSGFLYTYAMPYSYIDLDINPSIEITTNRFDHIIHVKGINSDGEALISNKSIIFKSLKDGVSLLLDQLDSKEYLSEEKDNSLVFTIISDDKSKIDNFSKDISNIIDEKLDDIALIDVYILNTDMQKHEDAKTFNISSGKLLLIEEVQKTQTNLPSNDMKSVPIKDIIKIYNQNKNNESVSQETSKKLPFIKQIKFKKDNNEIFENDENRSKSNSEDTKDTFATITKNMSKVNEILKINSKEPKIQAPEVQMPEYKTPQNREIERKEDTKPSPSLPAIDSDKSGSLVQPKPNIKGSENEKQKPQQTQQTVQNPKEGNNSSDKITTKPNKRPSDSVPKQNSTPKSSTVAPKAPEKTAPSNTPKASEKPSSGVNSTTKVSKPTAPSNNKSPSSHKKIASGN